jgi:hypothetical protein
MYSINAISLTPAINDWLAKSRQPRILHIFDCACNLINERREMLSIVTSEIGNGPFNLVVEDDVCFSENLNLQSQITISGNQLSLGDLIIKTNNAKLWSPRPDWERLHVKKDDIADQLTKLQITTYKVHDLNTASARNTQVYSTIRLQSLVSNLPSALVVADISSALKITSQLAGLGAGLTPAGDDFIMGAIYAVWVIHPPEIASVLAQEIANTAAPLTTSLSAAWLRSAGRGEAGSVWHEFLNALVAGNTSAIQLQMTKLLAFGHTSGADALVGFIGSFMCWTESQTHKS